MHVFPFLISPDLELRPCPTPPGARGPHNQGLAKADGRWRGLSSIPQNQGAQRPRGYARSARPGTLLSSPSDPWMGDGRGVSARNASTLARNSLDALSLARLPDYTRETSHLQQHMNHMVTLDPPAIFCLAQRITRGTCLRILGSPASSKSCPRRNLHLRAAGVETLAIMVQLCRMSQVPQGASAWNVTLNSQAAETSAWRQHTERPQADGASCCEFEMLGHLDVSVQARSPSWLECLCMHAFVQDRIARAINQ